MASTGENRRTGNVEVPLPVYFAVNINYRFVWIIAYSRPAHMVISSELVISGIRGAIHQPGIYP